MPRLPRLLAEGTEAPSGGGPRIPMSAAESGAAAFSQAGQSISNALATGGEVRQKQYNKNVDVESTSLRHQFDLEVGVKLEQLKSVEQDPDAYRTASEKIIAEAETQIGKRAKYPETRANLTLHAGQARAARLTAVEQYSRQLSDQRNEGLLKEGLAALKIDGANAPEVAAEGRDAAMTYYQRGLRAIDGSTLNPEKKANERLKWRNDFFYERGYRDLQADPDANIGRYREVLLPESFDRLMKAQETAQAKELARQRQEEKQAADGVAAARKDREQELDDLLTQGDVAAATERVNFYADNRMLDPDTIRRVRTDIASPKEKPSDGGLLSRLELDVESSTPRTTELEIDRAHERYQQGLPGLNRQDAVRLKNQLRSTKKAAQDEVKQEQLRRHGQAEQELRAVLGIKPGVLVQALGDDPLARLYQQGLTELRMESNAYDGRSDPLAYFDKTMRERYIKAAGVNAQLKEKEIVPLLVAPTRQALEDQKKAGRITHGLYLNQLRLWDQLDRIRGPQQQQPGAGGGSDKPKPAPRMGEEKKKGG